MRYVQNGTDFFGFLYSMNLNMRALQELLPFLADGIDDDDEVLVAIARSLGNFVDHVGGPQYAETLLPTLELLLTVGKLLFIMFPIHTETLTYTTHMDLSLILRLFQRRVLFEKQLRRAQNLSLLVYQRLSFRDSMQPWLPIWPPRSGSQLAFQQLP